MQASDIRIEKAPEGYHLDGVEIENPHFLHTGGPVPAYVGSLEEVAEFKLILEGKMMTAKNQRLGFI